MHKRYKLEGVIFDLDGTLLNTLADIADAENKTLTEYGLPTLPVEQFRWIVGGGADNIAQRLLPISMHNEQAITNFVQRFRFHYHQNWHTKTCFYDGVTELLTQLKIQQIKLAILSNKPEEFALKIVDFYFPDWQEQSSAITFTHVMGQSNDKPVKPNPQTALEIANDWNTSPDCIGFIGDSDIDILTANNAGMVSIGAEWGFRGKEELITTGAELILETPLELLNYIF